MVGRIEVFEAESQPELIAGQEEARGEVERGAGCLLGALFEAGIDRAGGGVELVGKHEFVPIQGGLTPGGFDAEPDAEFLGQSEVIGVRAGQSAGFQDAVSGVIALEEKAETAVEPGDVLFVEKTVGLVGVQARPLIAIDTAETGRGCGAGKGGIELERRGIELGIDGVLGGQDGAPQ